SLLVARCRRGAVRASAEPDGRQDEAAQGSALGNARAGADALMELVRNYAHVEAPSGPDPYFVVHVPPEGPAEVAAIPLPAEMVEALRASAKIEPVLVDTSGAPVTRGRTRTALPPKVVRGVRLRDGKCRWPGCDRRAGLQVHHLWPVSWGGGDDQSNLA